MNPDNIWHSSFILTLVFQAGVWWMFQKSLDRRVTNIEKQELAKAIEARVEKLEDQGSRLAVIETKLGNVEEEMRRMRGKLEQVLERAK